MSLSSVKLEVPNICFMSVVKINGLMLGRCLAFYLSILSLLVVLLGGEGDLIGFIVIDSFIPLFAIGSLFFLCVHTELKLH